MRYRLRTLLALSAPVLPLLIAACIADADVSGLPPPADGGVVIDANVDAATPHDAGTADVVHADAGTDAQDAAPTPDAADGAVPTPAPDFLWFVLDETTGTTAHDSTANHYDVTNLTGVTWSAGAHFDGTGGGDVAVDPSFRSPPVTFTVWLTPENRTDGTTLPGLALEPFPTNAVSGDFAGSFGFGLGLNVWTDGDGGSALAFEDLGTCQASFPTPRTCALAPTPDAGAHGAFAGGAEAFIAVTIGPAPDAGADSPALVYVDGALYTASSAAPLATVASASIFLGRHNGSPNYGTKNFFHGRIRDARIYRREIGAAEIAQLFANGPQLHAP